MLCPTCNTPMNHHADKPLKEPGTEECELIAAIHSCPNCGKVEAEIVPSLS